MRERGGDEGSILFSSSSSKDRAESRPGRQSACATALSRFCNTVVPALAALILVYAAKGQYGEDAWNDLVTQGQRAVGNKQYASAEQLFLKAVHEAERFAADDWRVGVTLQSLGQVYGAEKKMGEALGAYQRSLAILSKHNGDDSVEVASVNFDLASLAFESGRYAEALTWARKTLPVYEHSLGGTNLQTAAVLCVAGDSLRATRNFSEAEAPLRRCADIREKDGGVDNVELAAALHSLALAYAGEGKYALAEPRFRLAEKIRENKLGLTSPLLARTMEDHAAMLKVMGRDKEAERLIRLSSAILRSEKNNGRSEKNNGRNEKNNGR